MSARSAIVEIERKTLVHRLPAQRRYRAVEKLGFELASREIDMGADLRGRPRAIQQLQSHSQISCGIAQSVSPPFGFVVHKFPHSPHMLMLKHIGKRIDNDRALRIKIRRR